MSIGSSGTPRTILGVPTLRRLLTFWAAIAVSGWLFANPVGAQAESADESSAEPRWGGPWQPPEPNPSGWDWVRLKSDEWVKGEVVLMRDFDLQFDSDEFGVVKIDWDDVAQILTERVYSFVLQDMETTHIGTMAMRDDRVSVNVGDKIVTFDRSQLLAITPNARRELNLWSARASIGIGLRSGNTEQAEISGTGNLSREGTNTRLKFDYNGIYGSLNKQKNTNNHRGSSIFDYFLTPDLFLTPVSFEAYTDEFQNVSYRLTPLVGIGYSIVRRSALEWEVRLLGGYQHVRLDSAVPGDSKTLDNGAIAVGTSIDAELTSRLDLILKYRAQLIVPDTDQTNHHTEATLEFELTSVIDLDVAFVWDRIEDPATEADGNTPDKDDLRLTVGLALEF